MKNIVTIWWWNWQSNLLSWLLEWLDGKINISSIVSMSDDWRTTWDLIRAFDSELNTHLPPPGDLRRCLFSLSNSKYREYFKLVFEYVFLNEDEIKNLTIFDLFKQVNKELLFFWKGWELKDELKKFINFSEWNLYEYIDNKCSKIFDFKLPLNIKLKWHKFWNILMASVFYNFNKDYEKMIDFMHILLEVDWEVIPVTTKRAFIKAILWNGDIIESQDRISNVADYTSWIADLELMDCSTWANQNTKVHDTILKADYIIVGPGDLFTSIISNFIIGWVKESIKETNAKIIYIWNSTNKWWETTWLTQLDFINKIERFLWKRIDYFVLNDKKPNLSDEDKIIFKNNISVKWWDYLFLSNWERSELIRRKIEVIEADLLDNHSFYKHNKQKISKIILDIIQK